MGINQVRNRDAETVIAALSKQVRAEREKARKWKRRVQEGGYGPKADHGPQVDHSPKRDVANGAAEISLLAEIIAPLMKYAGETGKREGALDILRRLIDEREQLLRATNRNGAGALPSVRDAITRIEVMLHMIPDAVGAGWLFSEKNVLFCADALAYERSPEDAKESADVILIGPFVRKNRHGASIGDDAVSELTQQIG